MEESSKAAMTLEARSIIKIPGANTRRKEQEYQIMVALNDY